FFEICRAIKHLADIRSDIVILFPVHPNPSFRAAAHKYLANHPRIHLSPPLDYITFVAAMKAAFFILTDSGGIQEEAPSLGKPVLVLRNETERP
ncbi:UDP-N-acetylglucosamine 2-epimerase, partial [Klebsiella pneumoniae]